MTDKILMHGAQFFARHGVSAEERRVGGRFVVDVELTYDLSRAGATDDLVDTISYSDIYRVTRDIIEGHSFHLLEKLAQTIAETLLVSYPADSVLVRVLKQPPPTAGILDSAGVEIFRQRK